jgi:hypothetical protein
VRGEALEQAVTAVTEARSDEEAVNAVEGLRRELEPQAPPPASRTRTNTGDHYVYALTDYRGRPHARARAAARRGDVSGVKRLRNGNLLVPARAESDDGGVIGDGMVEIGPDDPDYDEWVRELERQAATAPPQQ